MNITGINGQSFNVNSEKVNIKIKGAYEIQELRGAVLVKNFKLPSQSISNQLIREIESITNVTELQPYKEAHPKILIGQDNWRIIVTREFVDINRLETAISRCALGWAVHAPVYSSCGDTCKALNLVNDNSTADDEQNVRDGLIDYMLKSYFDIENIGLEANKINDLRRDRATEILHNTSKYKNGYWETGLLWNGKREPNTSGRITAEKRLKSLEKKLDRDAQYATMYYREMERLIESGYANQSSEKDDARTWFLPHFGVINANKPGKIRLVFDAAAKTNGVSLNDQLEAGPDLLRPLPGILIRFRRYAIAIISDIKDMFLRVNVREEDRNAQLFLYRGKHRNKPPIVYKMNCLIFGAKSSPCSANFIKNMNAKKFENKYAVAAEHLINNTYMDDLITSISTEGEAEKLIRNVIEINREGNFEMHGWACNKSNVLNVVARDIKKIEKDLKLGGEENERVLGLVWDSKKDILKFDVTLSKIKRELLDGSRVPTKREVLAVIMSVFDPLGLLAPFTLKSKLLMKSIWKSEITWDMRLQQREEKEWRRWLRDVDDLRRYRVPRRVLPSQCENLTIELHTFCDASDDAYAAATYLRAEDANGEVRVNLVMSKCRVAPKKCVSTPRLELQAALIGARLAKFVETELQLKINKKYYWSDSSTVIKWIRGKPREFQVYVANRLAEITEITSIGEWRWVPTGENPADYATRDKMRNEDEQRTWFDGPKFLKRVENEWPSENVISQSENNNNDNVEKKREYAFVLIVRKNQPFTLYTRLLGWQGYLIVARRVRKIFYHWYHRTVEKEDYLSVKGECEKFWIRDAQSEYFAEEIEDLDRGREIDKRSKLLKLNVFLDDGILRVHGRATRMPNNAFNNCPIIMEGRGEIIKLIIKEYHAKYHHASNEIIVNEIKQIYFVFGLRGVIKSIASRCFGCKVRRGKPSESMMGALPEGRLAFRQRPFSHCGVDYFGPMLVKIGRRREKRWGVIFTCLTTRAVHLEIANSLTAGSAIMAVQRLAARRGSPMVIYSDNGTNFKAASKELKIAVAEIDKNYIESFANRKNLEWRFNPPQAPHMGGAWERLIRSVKAALHSILNAQVTTDEVLHTTLVEIEHSINSRPLTHLSVDYRDNEALTPNHFLIGSSSGEIKLGKCDPENVCIRRQWRIAQSFADAFWKRWLKEYLPNIISRSKWNKEVAPMEVGDLVLIIDFQSSRNEWRKGIVTRVMPGSDKIVRVAEIHTPHGNVVRPVHRLITLAKNVQIQN